MAVVRIKGNVGIDPEVEKTLQSLRLGKAFTAALFEQSETVEGMLHKAQRYLTWGKPNKQTIFTLLKRSGSFSGDLATLSEKLEKGEEALEMPVYVQLRPPRKGFKRSIKRAYKSNGEYGDRGDDINELIRRMV
ncbi:MAG: uL30 family ribosomal protein [Candidatus Caldarchaeum sp.]|nr:uL30 family ribosomal protein [Candidatus Caldarchaeum sp.]MDW8435448.1 uL30 family ribosomal protein [Candidatus Caldarchaeum sp.]